jgi:thioredoxin reductase
LHLTKEKKLSYYIGLSLISYVVYAYCITLKRELISENKEEEEKKLKRFPKRKKNNIIDCTRNDDKKKKENDNIEEKAFDVAIIGGGFAGLSSALLLGRYIRPTVIFDSGNTRNSTTRQIHGYLGYENVCPTQLIKKAWKDVMQYRSITVINEKIEKVSKCKDFFLLTTDKKRISIKSRYVIIATGIEDIKPSIKNFVKFDGNGAWHCPHCDGFQSTGKRLIIISSGDKAINYAKEFLGWTEDITLFINDSYQIKIEELDEAKKLKIKVIQNDIPVKINVNKKGSITGIVCKSGRLYLGDVIFYYIGYKVRNQIARQLGCGVDDQGFVKVNNMQQTTIPNVYAVGDIATDRHYVVLATASGALAAISIYESLLKHAIKRKHD